MPDPGVIRALPTIVLIRVKLFSLLVQRSAIQLTLSGVLQQKPFELWLSAKAAIRTKRNLTLNSPTTPAQVVFTPTGAASRYAVAPRTKHSAS